MAASINLQPASPEILDEFCVLVKENFKNAEKVVEFMGNIRNVFVNSTGSPEFFDTVREYIAASKIDSIRTSADWNDAILRMLAKFYENSPLSSPIGTFTLPPPADAVDTDLLLRLLISENNDASLLEQAPEVVPLMLRYNVHHLGTILRQYALPELSDAKVKDAFQRTQEYLPFYRNFSADYEHFEAIKGLIAHSRIHILPLPRHNDLELRCEDKHGIFYSLLGKCVERNNLDMVRALVEFSFSQYVNQYEHEHERKQQKLDQLMTVFQLDYKVKGTHSPHSLLSYAVWKGYDEVARLLMVFMCNVWTAKMNYMLKMYEKEDCDQGQVHDLIVHAYRQCCKAIPHSPSVVFSEVGKETVLDVIRKRKSEADACIRWGNQTLSENLNQNSYLDFSHVEYSLDDAAADLVKHIDKADSQECTRTNNSVLLWAKNKFAIDIDEERHLQNFAPFTDSTDPLPSHDEDLVRVLRAMLLRMCEALPVAEEERIGYLTHPILENVWRTLGKKLPGSLRDVDIGEFEEILNEILIICCRAQTHATSEEEALENYQVLMHRLESCWMRVRRQCGPASPRGLTSEASNVEGSSPNSGAESSQLKSHSAIEPKASEKSANLQHLEAMEADPYLFQYDTTARKTLIAKLVSTGTQLIDDSLSVKAPHATCPSPSPSPPLPPSASLHLLHAHSGVQQDIIEQLLEHVVQAQDVALSEDSTQRGNSRANTQPDCSRAHTQVHVEVDVLCGSSQRCQHLVEGIRSHLKRSCVRGGLGRCQIICLSGDEAPVTISAALKSEDAVCNEIVALITTLLERGDQSATVFIDNDAKGASSSTETSQSVVLSEQYRYVIRLASDNTAGNIASQDEDNTIVLVSRTGKLSDSLLNCINQRAGALPEGSAFSITPHACTAPLLTSIQVADPTTLTLARGERSPAANTRRICIVDEADYSLSSCRDDAYVGHSLHDDMTVTVLEQFLRNMRGLCDGSRICRDTVSVRNQVLAAMLMQRYFVKTPSETSVCKIDDALEKMNESFMFADRLQHDRDYIIDGLDIRVIDPTNYTYLPVNVVWNNLVHQLLQLRHNLPLTMPPVHRGKIDVPALMKTYDLVLGFSASPDSTADTSIGANSAGDVPVGNVALHGKRDAQLERDACDKQTRHDSVLNQARHIAGNSHSSRQHISPLSERSACATLYEDSSSMHSFDDLLKILDHRMTCNHNKAILIVCRTPADARNLYSSCTQYNQTTNKFSVVTLWDRESPDTSRAVVALPGQLIVATAAMTRQDIDIRALDAPFANGDEEGTGLDVIVTFSPTNAQFLHQIRARVESSCGNGGFMICSMDDAQNSSHIEAEKGPGLCYVISVSDADVERQQTQTGKTSLRSSLKVEPSNAKSDPWYYVEIDKSQGTLTLKNHATGLSLNFPKSSNFLSCAFALRPLLRSLEKPNMLKELIHLLKLASSDEGHTPPPEAKCQHKHPYLLKQATQPFLALLLATITKHSQLYTKDEFIFPVLIRYLYFSMKPRDVGISATFLRDKRRDWVGIAGCDEILRINDFPEYLNDSILLWIKKQYIKSGKASDMMDPEETTYGYGDLPIVLFDVMRWQSKNLGYGSVRVDNHTYFLHHVPASYDHAAVDVVNDTVNQTFHYVRADPIVHAKLNSMSGYDSVESINSNQIFNKYVNVFYRCHSMMTAPTADATEIKKAKESKKAFCAFFKQLHKNFGEGEFEEVFGSPLPWYKTRVREDLVNCVQRSRLHKKRYFEECTLNVVIGGVEKYRIVIVNGQVGEERPLRDIQ